MLCLLMGFYDTVCQKIKHVVIGGCYDITTMGAFTAYAQKYKHGGLRRLLKQVKENTGDTTDARTRLQRVCNIFTFSKSQKWQQNIIKDSLLWNMLFN